MSVSPLSLANHSSTDSQGADLKLTVTIFSGAAGGAAGEVVPPADGTWNMDPGATGGGMVAGCWADAQPATPARPAAAATTPGSHFWNLQTGSAPDRVPRRSRMDVPQNCEPSPAACGPEGCSPSGCRGRPFPHGRA